ncbi:MAG: hypothetical protein UDM12_08730 [Prevotellamassilia sp.]|nr:hypothetical protein [Prevotellamassilia sp.]
MKKEYIKPTSEAVNFFPESAMMSASGEMNINSDDTEAIDDINQMKSNHQGIGKGLWD